MTLKDAKVGKTYKVVRINGHGPLKRRIMDMGITRGTSIFVRKVAPLGDPVQFNIRNYELSLRREDSSLIEVEEIA